MLIRAYDASDLNQVIDVFYETVHTINRADYTEVQLNAWANKNERMEKLIGWQQSLYQNIAYVAVANSLIIGFGDMTEKGYLDRLYVHADYQRCGAASAILSTLEDRARHLQLASITTDASITAKPFFEKRGFQVVAAQTVYRHGVALNNYKMEKKLTY